MIPASQKDEVLLADIRAANKADLHIWWLGQSGFLVKWQDTHLLFDPYLSDSLTKKYATTDKPHIRMSEQVISPESLDMVDVVTSSHNHTDHLDGETLIPLFRSNPHISFIIPEANRDFVVNRLKCALEFPIGLVADENHEAGGVRVTAIPAAHETLETNEKGQHVFLGYIVEIGPWTLYHSGDTMLYEGMEKRLQSFDIDIAILPINGRAPERRVAGNLTAKEAVELAVSIGAKWVIPCHYDMFTFNTADPSAFVSIAQQAGQAYRVMKGGERWSLEK